MQVLLNTDPQLDGRHKMAEHLDTIVQEALGRFDEQITRVEAHLAEVGDHASATPGDITCTLEARLVGLTPVVVKDHASTAHQAMHNAVGKLKRAVGTVLAKHDTRLDNKRGATRVGAAAADSVVDTE
ncbi:MAG: ribosomal subunit interface protein [Burkholderiales bacterium]|nr:ribosomal subunit interface protein [Burkholderiales bacterium]